ncbi:hypothetical protein TNCT_253071 [Trichonephila clavata]|uniref:Uncharacterized protein n=1 Tax=Trichonephila clavata TaxID=2740835 RepID=A0A8X6KI96_TRICU|nr:hypothetical protein TNCT_253071 [Trichonephila clavata]
MRKISTTFGSYITATRQATPLSLSPSCWQNRRDDVAPATVNLYLAPADFSLFARIKRTFIRIRRGTLEVVQVVHFLLDEDVLDTSAWSLILPQQQPTGD